MDKIFGELRKLPCHYCKYANCYASACLNRIANGDGEYEECEDIDLDMEVVALGIEGYFKYLESIKKKR